MSERESARHVDAEAAAWAVRLDEHGQEPGVEAAVAAWLAGDRRRAGALLRAQAALSLIDRGRALGGPGASTYSPAARRARPAWRIATGTAVAASLLAAVLGLTLGERGDRRYETIVGELRRVPLEDGSIATLNTESRVGVDLTDTLRLVQVGEGEVWFKVAKDPARPFVVAAGRVRVRAVGTEFSVRRREGGADVLVTEGVVETWVEGRSEPPVRVAAGTEAVIRTDQPPAVAAMDSTEMARSLAWRDGKIALRGDTLAHAAAEFNRYNTRKLVITDPTLASQKLVGQFRTDEVDAFAAAVAATYGARIERRDDAIKLSPGSRP